MEIKKSLMSQNFKNDIDWIIDAYELVHVTLPDGFQKDAIQNAAGARGKSCSRSGFIYQSFVDLQNQI